LNRLVPRVALGVGAGVALYIGLTIWADAGHVAEALRQFAWRMAVLACALAAGNYLIRFLRWQYYLRVLGISVGTRDSLSVFLAGFALTVTPGKLGEAVKAFLLRASHGVALARSAPIVVAERVTDLLALLLLALVGVSTCASWRRRPCWWWGACWSCRSTRWPRRRSASAGGCRGCGASPRAWPSSIAPRPRCCGRARCWWPPPSRPPPGS
jgi:uncharacterized membrane protein YbhN (UPF0104 family)